MISGFNYFYTTDGLAFHIIGCKRDLYNWVALLVRNKRLYEPEFLPNKCVYDLSVLELYNICKSSGFVLVKMKSYSEDGPNG